MNIWSAYRVAKPEDMPTTPHYGAVLFGTRKEVTRSSGDEPGIGLETVSVPEVLYFAFRTKEMLAKWVGFATQDNRRFFFFEVKKIGTATITVAVDLGI